MLQNVLRSKAFKATEAAVSKTVDSFNQRTGLSPIKLDRLKEAVELRENSFNAAKRKMSETRRNYELAVANRSKVQAEINSLLQRKQDWSASDVSRCADCYQKEHTLKVLEEEAKKACAKQEHKVESIQNDFLRDLRSVYQEETALSQRAKVLSSYFTWGLILLNSSIFLASALIIDPRKREIEEARLKHMIREESLRQHHQNLEAIGEIKKSLKEMRTSEEKLLPVEMKSSGNFEIDAPRKFEVYQPQAFAFFLGGAITYLLFT